MKKNRGFTLVELLAVIIIVGVLSVISIMSVSRLINKSRDSQLTQQENTLSMAAEGYLQANRIFLPKSIGQTIVLSANTLKDAGYLKTNIKNSKGEDCMAKSIVKVTKQSKTKYDYKTYLYCGNDKVPNEEKVDEPVIKIEFVNENGEKANPDDVAVARFMISYKGNEGKTLGIQGYSYTILASTTGSKDLKEVYSTGTLDGKKSYEISVNKLLKEYVDITTVTNVKIRATAINEAGGIKDDTSTLGAEEESMDYGDKKPPICSSKKGESTGDWINKALLAKNGPRSVTAYCEDGKGSGCVRDEYTMTWPNNQLKSAVYGYIEVKDNANNPSEPKGENASSKDVCSIKYDTSDPCLAKVFVDTVAPTITIEAVNSGGASVFNGATTTNNGDIITIEASKYKNLTNGWGNATNYSGGITYKVKLKDDIQLKSWVWETNPKNLASAGAFQYNALQSSNPDGVKKTIIDNTNKYCGVREKEITIGFKENGRRKGQLIVEDIAGNTTTYIIEFNLDTALPSCKNEGGTTQWKNKSTIGNGVTITGKCSDTGGSECNNTKNNTTAKKTYTTNTNKVNELSPGIVYDNAGNSKECDYDRTVQIDITPPRCSWSADNPKWTKNDFTIKVEGKDEGGSNIDPKFSGKPWEYKSGTHSEELLKYTVKDIAGNETKCDEKKKIYVDKEPPKCEKAEGAPKKDDWSNKKRVITQTCSDKGSGCVQPESKTYNSGTVKTDSVVIKDAVGNVQTKACTYNVYFDNEPPNCTTTSKPAKATSAWVNEDVTLYGTCKVTNGSPCEKTTAIKGSTFKTSMNTKKSPGVKVKDKAGNETTCPDVKVMIDKDKPTCDPSQTSSGTAGVSGKINCNDGSGSGCSSSNTTTFTNLKSYKSYKIKDTVGNIGTCNVNITSSTIYRKANNCDKDVWYSGVCYTYAGKVTQGHCNPFRYHNNLKYENAVYLSNCTGIIGNEGGQGCCQWSRNGCYISKNYTSGDKCGWGSWNSKVCTVEADVCESKKTYSLKK